MKDLRKAIVTDANPDRNGLHVAWKIGALRALIFRGVDEVIDARTWVQAMADLRGVYDEISFFGHARPGGFSIGHDNTLTDLDLHLLAAHVHPGTLIWLRGCAAFHGEEGHALAMRMVRILKCRVAAHTYIIGLPWHSGGRSLRPGAKPHWSVKEGFSAKGYKGTNLKIKTSGPFEPNTMSFLSTSFPDKW